MRYVAVSLTFTILPACTGLALLWSGHPWIAAAFFIAATLGLVVDVLALVRAIITGSAQ